MSLSNHSPVLAHGIESSLIIWFKFNLFRLLSMINRLSRTSERVNWRLTGWINRIRSNQKKIPISRLIKKWSTIFHLSRNKSIYWIWMMTACSESSNICITKIWSCSPGQAVVLNPLQKAIFLECLLRTYFGRLKESKMICST